MFWYIERLSCKTLTPLVTASTLSDHSTAACDPSCPNQHPSKKSHQTQLPLKPKPLKLSRGQRSTFLGDARRIELDNRQSSCLSSLLTPTVLCHQSIVFFDSSVTCFLRFLACGYVWVLNSSVRASQLRVHPSSHPSPRSEIESLKPRTCFISADGWSPRSTALRGKLVRFSKTSTSHIWEASSEPEAWLVKEFTKHWIQP